MPGADQWLTETTIALVDSAMEAVRAGAKAPVEADWLRIRYAGMEVLALTVLAGALLVVLAGAALRRDGRAMVRASLLAVAAVPAMTLGLGLLHTAVGIGDELAGPAAVRVEQQTPVTKQFLQPTQPQPSPSLPAGLVSNSAGQASNTTHGGPPSSQAGVLAVPRVVLAGAALMVLLQSLARDAALSAAALAAPVTFVAGLWPAARPLATRTAGVVVALLLSRFVMLTVLDVGLAQLGSTSYGTDPLRANLALTTVFVLTAIAPWLLVRGTPILIGMLNEARAGSTVTIAQDEVPLVLGSLGPAEGWAGGQNTAVGTLQVLHPGGDSQ